MLAAAETYQEQAFKVLDRQRTEVRYNSEWLNRDLDPARMVELCAKYTVARMLEALLAHGTPEQVLEQFRAAMETAQTAEPATWGTTR